MKKQKQTRSRSEDSEQAYGFRKMRKRAAACPYFKDKSVRLSGKSDCTKIRREVTVKDELAAIELTAGQSESRPNRRLTDFVFHDADGNPQSVEMLEVENLFISGLLLPLEESAERRRERGVRCEGFGRVESWAISGYDEGSPVIWISTNKADYDCLKPSKSYKRLHNLFFEKARVCVEVYKKLSRTCGGNPDLIINQLLAGVVCSMSDSKNFPDRKSIEDFIISQGEFIYKQLIGLDATSEKNDHVFENLPVLVALMDETNKQRRSLTLKTTASMSFVNTSLKTCEGWQNNQFSSSACGAIEVEGMKLARLLQEKEKWGSMEQKKNRRQVDEKSEAIKQTRSRSEDSELAYGFRKMRKRAAACPYFKDKSVCLSGKSDRTKIRREVSVKDELAAIELTAGRGESRPNRRLTDFVFHGADGNPQSVEMLEVENLFISGLLLPLEESVERRKERGVRCEGFGRVESWAISGYDEGSPVIWISTNKADYDCLKPSKSYKRLHNLFFEKARACVEVYKKLSRTCGGNPDLAINQLLAGVVCSMSGSKNFPDRKSIEDFIISQGEFIYNQLIGLDLTSEKNDQVFENLPVLLALMDEAKKQRRSLTPKTIASISVVNTSLKTCEGWQNNQFRSSAWGAVEVEDMKLARLLQEKEKWGSMEQKKNPRQVDGKSEAMKKQNQTRSWFEDNDQAYGCWKMSKRAAACPDFKDKSVLLSGKSDRTKIRGEVAVKDELAAIELTAGQGESRPNRRLTDFVFHDADGNPQSVEMLEVENLFISGLLLPLEESVERRKERGVRCEGFGRVESWAISGYDEGSPVIWISTNKADYDCLKPSKSYKRLHSLFFEKARACMEVYKKLSRTCGGNPDLTINQLLAGVVCSMNDSKNFPDRKSIEDFIISQGEFIYKQLIGLDATSKKNDQVFENLPVLMALMDETKKQTSFLIPKNSASSSVLNTSLKTHEGGKNIWLSSSACGAEEVEDMKLARLLQEKEQWGSMEQKKTLRQVDGKSQAMEKQKQTRSRFEDSDQAYGCRKMPKRAAACPDFKDKSVRLSGKSDRTKIRGEVAVKDELAAIELTAGQGESRPNRRLTDFVFHDADGNPQSVEMLEVENLFISGLLLPLEESVERRKERGVRCEGFGRVESWAISGYDEGSPVIWISTNKADYDCLKPSKSYKRLHNLFFEKARACMEVYKKLSRTCGGNPDLTINQLLAGVVCSMNDSKNFPDRKSIEDFIISQGEFIYKQLIGLDATSKKNDQVFENLPVLMALMDETKKQMSFLIPKNSASSSVLNTSLKTHEGGKNIWLSSSACGAEEVEDMKLARLLQEKEQWGSMEQKKTLRQVDGKSQAMEKQKQTRSRFEDSDQAYGCRKMPKRAAACPDFKDKSVRLSGKSFRIEFRKEIAVKDELAAIELTVRQDASRPNRRLTDFIFHDADRNPQSVEMLEVENLFISGLLLPLEESFERQKERGVRCEGFGRVESWAISGYDEGSPVIWISTSKADYECIKPAKSYKGLHNLFSEKARACIEVYKKLSRTSGGNPDLTINQLLAGVACSMSDSKNFPDRKSIKNFIISQGEFIYNQLIGLDATSKKNDQVFENLPVLVALTDENKKQGSFLTLKISASSSVLNTGLITCQGGKNSQSSSSACGAEGVADMKSARLLLEKEKWESMEQKKTQCQVAPSNKLNIKINEDEVANDYPLPAYYNPSAEETNECIAVETGYDRIDPDELPRYLLHNWSLYNSESRLISLELLPMEPCANVDLTIFGSGSMTTDDRSGFDLDGDLEKSSSTVQHVQGCQIFLSAIKEWMVRLGSSNFSISIRTDIAWYRLGRPSKQYAPWYRPVLKAVRLAIAIITLLKKQSRASRLSFADVIKRVSEFPEKDPAYISSNQAVVERYVVVHGRIILQQFAEFADEMIRKCAFVTRLCDKMEERHHTKWLVKKKVVRKKEDNLNQGAKVEPVVSKNKVMLATTTGLIKKIWEEFYSNHMPEDSKEAADLHEASVDDEIIEEQEENGEEDSEEVEEEQMQVDQKMERICSPVICTKSPCSYKDIKWDGESKGKTCFGESLYGRAIVCGDLVNIGSFVLVETADSYPLSSIYFVEYMFEKSDSRKMAHGRQMFRGSQTVLVNTADEREVFLTNNCLEFELEDVKEVVVVKIRLNPWGHLHRKANAYEDKIDQERAEGQKLKGFKVEYYCKSLYWPERGAFFCLPSNTMGLGSGVCHSCKMREIQRENEAFKLHENGFMLKGTAYRIHDFVYLAHHHFTSKIRDLETFKAGKNIGLKGYVIGQLLEINIPKTSKQACPESTKVKVRRFYRPEDISSEKAYCSDIREVYYSEEVLNVPIIRLEGKCRIQRKLDLTSLDTPVVFEHIFFCEHSYEPRKGVIKQLPDHVRLSLLKEKVIDDATLRKKIGKCEVCEKDDAVDKQMDTIHKNHLATLDIFAGCGGLTDGLTQSGVSLTKWAIEYEPLAGEAFKLNHPEALMFINNCNVILRAIMSACGDADDCFSTPEADKLAAELDEKEINNFPRPGQVEFINGGPPCQGFSGLNRFNQSAWSKVQCEMILAFLSFTDYFRPRFFLLENVRNFVTFKKGLMFRLTLASLLKMGYQVRFGILEAGAYGISQSRKRAFIWAASPEETLPEWPEPMHVFAGPELKVKLPGNSEYAAVQSTANGAPFRSVTVRDTIGDLPAVENGASATTMEYKNEPMSWFQKKIRGDMPILTDHISKVMSELTLIRCHRIPKHPGSDWSDLPNEKVRLSTGQVVDLIPRFLSNKVERHNQWKGMLGRLAWEGNFPTSITDPQPMGRVGVCFHPDQDRIITVREYARSQGFSDSYKFAGNIQHKYRQIGNAVPPPLAFALGRKLKEALEMKPLTQETNFMGTENVGLKQM